MKKVVFLCLLVLIIIPVTVKAASGYESYNGTYKWEYEDGVLTITSEGGRMIRDSLEHQWDPYRSEIKKIVFEGIDVIHKHNFENYPNLEEVILPKSMPGEIADYAFYNCPKLDHIELPEVISRIGKYAFYGTSITEVRIPIFLSWIDEHAFPDGTNIIKDADELGVIDAGTGGNTLTMADTSVQSEGKAESNTCYNKFYFGYYYDDTARWVLYEDGTLVVTGSWLIWGYSGSRIPWGCYKKQIKKIIFNDDKTGEIKIDENYCPAGLRYKVAIYASKTVEDIMSRRLKSIDGPLWDCREDCRQSTFNIDTIIINRGVEEVTNLLHSDGDMVDRDVYIDKHVKKFDDWGTFKTSRSDPKNTTLHIEVSPSDYINNNYSYKAIPGNYSFTDSISIFDGEKFINDPVPTYNDYFGSVVNDIDDTYVSINDTSAPDTIEVDGQTYYKYETYITNEDGVTNISIPNDATVEYVVKEIEAPNGCMVKGVTYKIDMLPETINLVIENPKPEPEEPEIDESTKENPITKDSILVVLLLSVISIILIIYCTKKERYYQ